MGEANPAAITVVTETRHLKTQPFVHTPDQIATGKAWGEWLEGIEREFRYFKLTEAQDKQDAMIIYGGTEIARLSKSLPDPVGEMNVYEKLRKKLNDYFTPQKNKHHARYIFLRMRPTSGESTLSYAARLREKANECDFGNNYDDRLLEHLIQTVENQTLIQRAINKKWDLSRFLTEAGQLEDISLQVKDMKPEEDRVVAMVSRQHRPTHSYNRENKPYKVQSGHKQACGYCGQTDAHEPGHDCPAYGKQCGKCKKWNHFAVVCKSKTNKHQPQRKPNNKKSRQKQKRHVKKTTERESDSSTSSDDEYFSHTVNHLKHVGRVGTIKDNDKTIQVRIDDVDVRVEPDSGADINIMDEHQFKALKHRSSNRKILTDSSVRLSTLQNELSVKGEFQTVIRNKTCGTTATFVVVKGKINSPPLISKNTLTELGMLKIDPDGLLAASNNLKIPEQATAKSIKNNSNLTAIQAILDDYPQVFNGIGRIRNVKENTEIYVHLHMKPEATPVIQKPRPVPYYLQKPLREWIDQGIEDGIFEEVPTGDPITWCSPLVVQPKPRYTKIPSDQLKPHMIRASVDLRVPNKFMERSRITQAPVVGDFMYKFHDCTIFSKLDLKHGYHQLTLDPESRMIATFSTPWGNIRSKRLIFGAKSSQDVFDETMYRIFGDIPSCLSQRDDILIGGRTIEEHNKTLKTVLQRATDYGVTFNREKCMFGVDNLEFYGYRFTNTGLKPAPEKVRAIKECSPPASKTAVRSFLGMTGYLSKFIPKYSVLTAPLRQLTRTETRFKWTEEEQTAFQQLKDSITNDSTITYFNPTKPIVVRAEASFHEGLSAGLFQETSQGLQPVHFISRSMTDTEKRYSQTEKDALAIRWAKTRFSMYLLGAPKFKIITAHKPLLPLFNKAAIKVPPRIEKWVMDMQDVDFDLLYEPGRDEADPLDFLSRHPLPTTGNDNTEHVIKHVAANEYAVVLDHITKETEKDTQLKNVRERILRCDWEKHKQDPDITSFYPVRQELSTIDGLIFRLNRIVIPRRLQDKVIRAGHSLGHLGITKTKQLLRERYWFPAMNSMTEEILKQCYECQVTTKEHRQEPIKMTAIPDKPWEIVSIDFGGPYPDGHYNLVIIDKRTRYPAIQQIPSVSIKPVTEKLKEIFASYGTPVRIESDNGPPFTSKEFADFAKQEGFYHHRVTPLHPRANGEAENFMKLLNKTEQIAHLQGRNSKFAVQEMLTGYRSTPHPAYGITPYQALMNRTVRTKLDYRPEVEIQQDMDKTINDRDREYKMKLKLNAENRNTKPHAFVVGDYVLLKQTKRNKWSTAYEPAFYIIYRISGSTIAARRVTDGREICRDSSHFKLVNAVVQNIDEHSSTPPTEPKSDEWRELILQTSAPEPDPTEINNAATDTDKTRGELRQPEPLVVNQRPLRNRRRPEYLKDYVE